MRYRARVDPTGAGQDLRVEARAAAMLDQFLAVDEAVVLLDLLHRTDVKCATSSRKAVRSGHSSS